jgi:hypothetical protein
LFSLQNKQVKELTPLKQLSLKRKSIRWPVSISSALGADLILLSNIEAGKSLPHEAAVSEHSTFDKLANWIFVAIALLIGLGSWYSFAKAQHYKREEVLLPVFLLIVVNCIACPFKIQSLTG